jgi:hypothetical protein
LQGFARFFKKPCNLCEKYAQYRASIQNKVLFCRNEGAYQVRRNIKTLDFRLKTVYYLVNTIRKERLASRSLRTLFLSKYLYKNGFFSFILLEKYN